MLFLLFELDSERYALDARQVKEVLPLLELKSLPQAPEGVVGLCNFHGQPVPVIDLCLLLHRVPARALISTRILLVHYVDDPRGERLLGLIAEQATEVFRAEPGDFKEQGFRQDETPYLGPVTRFRGELIQWVDARKLLPDAIRERLFLAIGES